MCICCSNDIGSDLVLCFSCCQKLKVLNGRSISGDMTRKAIIMHRLGGKFLSMHLGKMRRKIVMWGTCSLQRPNVAESDLLPTSCPSFRIFI